MNVDRFLLYLFAGSVLAVTLWTIMKTRGSTPLNKASSHNNLSTEIRKSDYYIYNYFKVHVNVELTTSNNNTRLASCIAPGSRVGVKRSLFINHVRNGVHVRVYKAIMGDSVSCNASSGSLLVESELRIPDNTTIKALHLGMISGHEDLSLASDPIKSTLGSAIPRIRLVNLMSKPLNLISGFGRIHIQPHSSFMYFGENQQGIHLGSIIRDEERILNDFVVDKPMTDIHFGIISDIGISLYTGSKFGGDLDDTTEVVNYMQELHGMGGPHRGLYADRSYIP